MPFQSVLSGDYARLERLDEAKAVVEKALAQKLDGPDLQLQLLRIAYIRDDNATQEKEVQWFAGKPEEWQSLQLQAVNALMHGQRRKASELCQQMEEVRQRQGLASMGPVPAIFDAFVGDCEAARKEKSSPDTAKGKRACQDFLGKMLTRMLRIWSKPKRDWPTYTSPGLPLAPSVSGHRDSVTSSKPSSCTPPDRLPLSATDAARPRPVAPCADACRAPRPIRSRRARPA